MTMTVRQLQETLNRMLKDAIVLPESEIRLRTVGFLSPGIELVTEKHLGAVSAQDLPNGMPVLKLIGIEQGKS